MSSNKKTIFMSAFVAVLLFLGTVANVSAFAIDVSNLKGDTRAIVINSTDVVPMSPYERGDVNEDGKIDEYDLFFLVRYIYLGGQEPANTHLADFNVDFSVNVGDVAAIANYLVEEGILDPQYAEYERGDVNTDGIIDLDDVYFLMDYIFNGGEKPNFLFLADINRDFQIDTGDVVALVDYLKDNGILIDEENAPEINLISPEDNDIFKTRHSEKDIDFEFIVSDENPIDYCELIVDNDVAATLDAPQRDEKITITLTLARDDVYSYQIKCADVLGNEGVSSKWDFDVRRKSSSNTDNKEDDKIIGTHNIDNHDNDDNTYTYNFDDTGPITINDDDNSKKESQITFFVEYLVPIFLGLCIILIIIMLGIVISRRNEMPVRHNPPVNYDY